MAGMTQQRSSLEKYTISGYLKDSLTTESLIGATAYTSPGLSGTSTNAYGFYSLTLPAGEVNLTYSHVGYTPKHVSFTLRKDTVINTGLSGTVHLGEVEITASRTDRIQEHTQMSAVRVPMIQLKAIPAFLGEVDILKALQLMPGIQSGGEGSSGLYVRGGGPDQNLILLDGVPVYNASHLFGFFSVFNTDAINNVELLKGGFPARYGGRISSVIDINMKEGNMQKFHGEGAVGIVSAKMTFEGPVWKDRTSFIVSARRTYIDLLAAPFIAKANQQEGGLDIRGGYYFYDMTAKINHRFSPKDRVYLSAYMGSDRFYVNMNEEYEFYDLHDSYSGTTSSTANKSGLTWGNMTAAFRWNHIFTNKLFGNTTLTYSRYRMDIYMKRWETERVDRIAETKYYGVDYQSGITDWSGRLAFDYLPSPDHYIRFGSNLTYHIFNPGAIGAESELIPVRFGGDKIHSYEYSVYAEDDVRLTSRLKANIGIHWSAFNVRGGFYNMWQPRISARYLLTSELSAKVSYSRMAQYVHLLTNSNLGLPTDLWVPATDLLDPQTSGQVAAGLAHNFREAYELSIEGYYKTMDRVIEYKEGASVFDVHSKWEDKIIQGEGRSYGMEMFAQKKTGSFTGWVGYTLSWSDRQFEALNRGQRFNYKYDRRHDISIVMMKKFGKKIELSGTWVFGSGNCITVPVGIFDASNPFAVQSQYDMLQYGERNGYRMVPYHRLDLSISFVRQKRWGERRWVIGVFNAYNRKNPYYIDIEEKDRYAGRTIQYVQYSLFPVIPSVSYHFKF
jgi:hypothetical protein